MSNTKYDVIGIGNAIVDIIARCNEAFLANHGMAKGFMQLISASQADDLYGAMGTAVEQSGGSAANTCAGIASLGGTCGFIGRVARDRFGDVFAHDIRAIGVAYDTPASGAGLATARCLVLVTPDGERTMNTFLGASTELGERDIGKDMSASAKITYLEGYLFDKEDAKAAFHQAAALARAAGRKVALSLSDAFCVDRHREDFLHLVRSGVDILFANEAEMTARYQLTAFEDGIGGYSLSENGQWLGITASIGGSEQADLFLMNAKSGLCPEDCSYCSQSKNSKAEIPKYNFLSRDKILEGARRAHDAVDERASGGGRAVGRHARPRVHRT